MQFKLGDPFARFHYIHNCTDGLSGRGKNMERWSNVYCILDLSNR